jgi:ABC-type glycerol-3-phosphate transport system permease component
MKRVLAGIALFAELTILALFGVAVAYGGFDQGVFFFLYIFGVILVVSAGTAWAMPYKAIGKAVTHGLLLVGCVVFSFPFVWLLSTSFKHSEEVFTYPPKWVPSVPGRIVQSPYVTAESFEEVKRPTSIDKARWPDLWQKLEAAIWEKGRPMLGEDRVVGLDAETLRREFVRGLWVVTSRGVPREAWEGGDEQIVAAVAERVDVERAEEVWGSIYRCVALRDMTVKDVHLVERALGEEENYLELWRPEEGSRVTCTRRAIQRTAGLEEPLVIEYDLADSDRVAVVASLPLPVPPEEFLSITVPIRQDRSWHRFRFDLEMDGTRYVPEHHLYLGQYRWQEVTFKLKSKDPSDERNVGVWPLVPSKQTSTFSEPGKFRLTFAIERTSRIGAIWHKYTSNYRDAYIAAEHRWNYLFNSVYLVVLNVVGQVLSCSLVAYAFARLKWPGRDIMFAVLLATMMLPPQVTMVPVFIVFKHLGWYNTLKALWVRSFLGSAFFIFLLRQFMKTIPVELEDAAKIDGCGFFGVYWKIMLPLLKPALAAVAIFTFMGTWNNFMGPLIYLNDQRLYPLALGLFDFRSQYGSEYGMLMAASTLMTLPVIAMFFMAQRHFIQGVTLTGMKG